MTRILLTAALLLLSVSASADAIDDAIAQLEEGEFDASRALLEGAPVSSHAMLVRLYETRARLAHALRDDAALDGALRALASLDPHHEFPPAAPPDLAQRLEELHVAALSLDVAVRDVGTGLSLTVQRTDPAALITGTRLHVRIGETAWDVSTEPSLALPVAAGERVSYWVEAIRGDLVLATLGSAEQPLTHARVGSPAEVAAESVRVPTEDSQDLAGDSRRRKRIIRAVGISAAILVVAAVVVAGVVYSQGVRDTQLQPPISR